MRADLHSHTIYSDGTFTIPEIIERAVDRDLDILAITDHDTFDGAKIAYEMGPKMGLRVIYGMELSTERNGESIQVKRRSNYFNASDNVFYFTIDNITRH